MPQVAAQLQELRDEMKEVELEMKDVQAQIDGIGTANPALTMILEERLTELEHQEWVHSQLLVRLLQQCAGECAAPLLQQVQGIGLSRKRDGDGLKHAGHSCVYEREMLLSCAQSLAHGHTPIAW